MTNNIIPIQEYCSELGEGFLERLSPQVINLVVAPTGSGKTHFFVTGMSREYKVGVLAPFTALTSQIYAANADYALEAGIKASDTINMANGVIASFHSSEKLLEMSHIDFLIIDEIHELINYAGFTKGMIQRFWKTIDTLKKQNPTLRIIALTGTPQFIKMADFLDIETWVIDPVKIKAKPSDLEVDSSWKTELNAKDSYIYLYSAKRSGVQLANKYDGEFLSSANKTLTDSYTDIINGQMPNSRLFTSTLIATGVSIHDPVEYVYTDWVDIVTIVQMSARVRQGGHKLRVRQVSYPPYLAGKRISDIEKPVLKWGKNYEKNFRLLKEYQEWYSIQAHQDPEVLESILHQMLWHPELSLPPL